MKQLLVLTTALLITVINSNAQEAVQELSKKSAKGYLSNVVEENDVYTITYKIPGDKKKNEIFFETYSFDNNIKFIKSEEVHEPKQTKEDKPDKTVSGFYANVGGCSSFDILSMKLKFTKFSELRTWDYKRQRYVREKTISSEKIKPKTELGKYEGYAAYNDLEDESLFVLAGQESNTNKNATEFSILSVTSDLDITSKPVDITGSQSLVYTAQLDNGDVVLVFAPNKKEPDIAAYTYLKYTSKGEVKNKVVFHSPANNLLVIDVKEKDGSVFFCATSTDSKDAYEEEFNEYAADIVNFCFTEGNNKKDMNWIKKAQSKMNNFHLLKFTGNHLDFASTAAVSDFKAKFKTPAGDKKADPYKGRKFLVAEFTVTPTGEYLVAGQLIDKTNLGAGNPVNTYEDIVCLHFDKAGQLRAQYGTEKMNHDKKSEIFPIIQSFMPSKDGKSMYWVVLEVKGFKGYASFIDAYNGNVTYHSRYFPRIAKLDIQNAGIGNFTVVGNEKFYVSKNFLPIRDKAENSLVFIGSDEDYKKLWLSKYVFE